MTFKRVAVLFAVILFVLDQVTDLLKQIPDKLILYTKISFIVLSIAYGWLLIGDNAAFIESITGFSLDKFTVGRQWYLSLVNMTGYNHGAYGSSSVILSNILGPGHYLEMDLVKMFIEMGAIAVVVFVNGYWNMVEKNRLAYLIMLMVFVNLLLSHSLTTPMTWTIRMITFGYIMYSKEEEIANE